jgi:DNA repair protein RadA/Sms
VSEIGAVTVRTTVPARVERPAVPIGEVDARRAEARTTGVGEFDRVLGGGIVPGAVVLVAGEPGIGKSTLLLDVAARAARSGAGRTVLYVSGEESAAQVRVRAERIEAWAWSTPSTRSSSSSTPCRPSAAARSRAPPATSPRSAR